MLEDDKAANGINMTPLSDICLTLVMVFMVTMPLSVIYGVTVKGESLRKFGLATPQEKVVVHLGQRGVYIEDEKGKEQPIPYTEFGVVLRQMIQVSETKEVLLKVDPTVPHGQAVWALDIAKQNGAEDIAIFEGAI
jgi:biopolymer transport protein ExbD